MLAAFVVIVAGMKAAESILNPLLLAVFVSVICAPAYLGLLRYGMSQWLSILIVTGALAVIMAVLTSVVSSSISRFTSDDKQAYYGEKIVERKDEIRDLIESWTIGRGESESSTDLSLDSISQFSAETSSTPASEDTFETNLGRANQSGSAEAVDTDFESSQPLMAYVYDLFNPGTVFSLATRLAKSLGSLLSSALLITLTVVFILLEVGSFEGKLKRAFPERMDTTQQAEQMVRSVQRYMVVKASISSVTAVLIGLWLLAGQQLDFFEVQYIALWVLLSFLLNFIPNIGSFIAAVPAVLIAWLEGGTQDALICASGYIVVNIAIGNFLEPRIMGKNLGLSPLVIFCSLVFWGWVLGPIGMLLSVPLTMTIHIVLNGFDDTRWIATLLGGQARDA